MVNDSLNLTYRRIAEEQADKVMQQTMSPGRYIIATQVKRYQGQRAMQSGIRKMARKGWVVQTTSTHLGKRGVLKFAIGFLAKQKEYFTVTFGKYSGS